MQGKMCIRDRDVSKGLLPEKRFQMLADRYDKEQAELTEKIEPVSYTHLDVYKRQP